MKRPTSSVVFGVVALITLALVGGVIISMRGDGSRDNATTFSRAQLAASDELWLSDVNGDARPDAIALDAQRVSVYLAVADGYRQLIDDDGAPVAVDVADGRTTVACHSDGTLFLQWTMPFSESDSSMMHLQQLQIDGAVGTWDIEPGFMVGPEFTLTMLGNGCATQARAG
jgi:hypothetical protein